MYLISVKKPILNLKSDPIVLGTFTFKKIEDFESTQRLIKRMDELMASSIWIHVLKMLSILV